MARSRRRIVAAAVWAVASWSAVAQDVKVDTPAAVAAALRVVIEPSYPWRYAQGGETYEWTVPSEAAEGNYFLAARFADADGKAVLTRSEIVFLAPEYPSLLAAAQAAVARAVEARGSMAPLVRDVSLPSVEMLLEDAQIHWSDFGRAPRDWDYVAGRRLSGPGRRRLGQAERPVP